MSGNPTRCDRTWQGYRCHFNRGHDLPHHAHTDPYGVGTLTWDHNDPEGEQP